MYLCCWLHPAYTPRSYQELQNLIKLCPQDTVPPKSFFHCTDDHVSLFPPLRNLNSIPTPGGKQRKSSPSNALRAYPSCRTNRDENTFEDQGHSTYSCSHTGLTYHMVSSIFQVRSNTFHNRNNLNFFRKYHIFYF